MALIGARTRKYGRITKLCVSFHPGIYDGICDSRSVCAQVCLLNFVAIIFAWNKIQQMHFVGQSE